MPTLCRQLAYAGLTTPGNNTAKAMGVSDRVDPYQSIGGGARYLEQVKADFADVPKTDRIWFSLAGYTDGPNAVKRIQRELRDQGIDDKSWATSYAYLDNIDRIAAMVKPCTMSVILEAILRLLKLRLSHYIVIDGL